MNTSDLKTLSLLELDLDDVFQTDSKPNDPKASPCACFTEEECVEDSD